MPEFLYKIQPTRPEMLSEGPTPQEAALIGQHFAYLEGLLESGVLILAGRTLDIGSLSFGIVIFRSKDDAEARCVLHNDPAVKGGVMRAELHPYRMALVEGKPNQGRQ